MNPNAPMRPSAFKPIGHYPHDSVITLSQPVIARPKPQMHDAQRSRSRSAAANRRKSAVSGSQASDPSRTANGNAFRAFFLRNRTRSISPTTFQAQNNNTNNSHNSVRRMRTEKPGMAATSASTGGIGGNGIGGIGIGPTGVRRMRTDTAGTLGTHTHGHSNSIGKYDVFVPPNPKRMTSDTQLQLQLSSDRLKSVTSITSDAQLQLSSDRLKSIDRYRTTGSPMVMSSDRLHSHVSHSSGYSPKLNTVHRPTPITLQPVSSAVTTATTGTTASGSSFGTISNANSNSRNSTTTNWAPRRQLSAFDSLPTLTNSITVPLSSNNNNNTTTNNNTNSVTSSSSNTATKIPKEKHSDRRSITVQDATIGGWMPERHNTTSDLPNNNRNMNGNSNSNDNTKPVRSRSRYGGRTRFWRFGNRRASMKDETDDSWKAGYMAGLKAGRDTSLTQKNIHHDDRDINVNSNGNMNGLFPFDSASSSRDKETKDTGKLSRMLSGNAGRRRAVSTMQGQQQSGSGQPSINNMNSFSRAPQEFRFGRGRRKRWTYNMQNSNNNTSGNNYNYITMSKNNNPLRERSHDDMSSVTRDSDSYDER